MSYYSAGDTVRLKSGGPRMTIVEPDAEKNRAYGSPTRVRCQWFAGPQMRTAVFLEDALELAPAEDPPRSRGGYGGGRY